jgi:hypothetical protein
MTVEGVVRNGVIVVDPSVPLPEGTRVQVLLPVPEKPSLADKLLALAGTVNDLPDDMAEQHDHYLHGTPKR